MQRPPNVALHYSACIAGNWRSVQICPPQLASLKDKKPILGYTFFSPPKTSQTCISTHTLPPNLIPPLPFSGVYSPSETGFVGVAPEKIAADEKSPSIGRFPDTFLMVLRVSPPQLYSSSCRIINSSSLSPSLPPHRFSSSSKLQDD